MTGRIEPGHHKNTVIRRGVAAKPRRVSKDARRLRRSILVKSFQRGHINRSLLPRNMERFSALQDWRREKGLPSRGNERHDPFVLVTPRTKAVRHAERQALGRHLGGGAGAGGRGRRPQKTNPRAW